MSPLPVELGEGVVLRRYELSDLDAFLRIGHAGCTGKVRNNHQKRDKRQSGQKLLGHPAGC